MLSLVTCISATQLPPSAPEEIVFIPEGENTITPFVDGKAKTITVRVPSHKGNEIAARMQIALQRRQSNTVRPFLDFEHKNGTASALPKAFRYESGKGIMLAVDWTSSGKSAVEGRDFSYFSPTFLIDDSGEPSDLPEKGAIGALVNEPAFRNLERIAASHAGGEELSGYELVEKALRVEAGEACKEIKATSSDDPRLAGLTGLELVEAALEIEAGVTVRKETKDLIRKMNEDAKPSAREQLDALADELIRTGKATSATAKAKAAEMRPDLFQEWLDSQPEASCIKAAYAPSNFPGLSGKELLTAALAAEE